MRRASFDKQFNPKRNNGNSQSSYQYRVSENSKNVEIKRLNYQNLDRSNQLQRSCSADNVVIRTRGFKPSDIHDPSKKHFLEHLTKKILHFDMDIDEKPPAPINLEKLLTPAMDCTELHQTKKKMYASSCFYAPTHPTVEDQVELARRISYSLSDAKNMKSKGQSMYVNRKKRSVKWIHDGNGVEADEEPQTPMHKDKVPLKCMMNPNGKVLDIHCIQALGEEPNIGTSPINAEKLFDIVRDLNNHKGRGAEIFAKRRKRSEKWVVDRDQPSTPPQSYPKTPTYPSQMDYGANENSKFSNIPPASPMNPPPQADSKPFFNPFTMDLTLGNGTTSGNDARRAVESHTRRRDYDSRKPEPEVKKIYLREVAIGPDRDYPITTMNTHHRHQNGGSVEKSRRMSFDSDRYESPQQYKPHRIQNHANHHYKHANHSKVRDNQYTSHQNGRGQMMDEEANDYTPVPVKQLIQEFEKTCRPVLQYKQMNARSAPVVQQPPIEDISRFFDAPTSQKYEEQRIARGKGANGKVASMNGNHGHGVGMNGTNGHQHQMMGSHRHELNGTQGHGRQANGSNHGHDLNRPDGRAYQMNGSNGHGHSIRPNQGNGIANGNGNVYSRGYQGAMVPRYEYDSTDDEIDDSFGDSSSSDNSQEYYGPSPGFSSGNRVSAMSDYDYRRQMFDCATDQLFDEKFEDTEAPIGDDEKALNFAMIASQDDIVEQIKQLRRTPVVENLVPGPSPDRSKLGDFIPELASKMLESTYNGPKISSYEALTNYNTAPRGWDQSQAVYRPITFRKPQEPIAYSDF